MCGLQYLSSCRLAAGQVHSHTMLRQLLQSILQMQEEAAP